LVAAPDKAALAIESVGLFLLDVKYSVEIPII